MRSAAHKPATESSLKALLFLENPATHSEVLPPRGSDMRPPEERCGSNTKSALGPIVQLTAPSVLVTWLWDECDVYRSDPDRAWLEYSVSLSSRGRPSSFKYTVGCAVSSGELVIALAQDTTVSFSGFAS